MKRINFSHNWNNKLCCKSFTTIRLRDDKKYKEGEKYNITLTKGKEVTNVSIGRVIALKHFKLDKLNEYIAHLDTGLNVKECRRTLLRLYDKVDFTKQELSLILINHDTPLKSA